MIDSGVVGLVLAVMALVVLFVAWQVFGQGPGRRRALRRGRQLLDQGRWQEAWQQVQGLQASRMSSSWRRRLEKLEGACLHEASQAALRDQNFEAALEHALQSARLLKKNAFQARAEVVEAMLQEVRARFASTPGMDPSPVQAMIQRVFQAQSPCREAAFWQGLCLLREGKMDLALAALKAARSGEGEGSPTGERRAFSTPAVSATSEESASPAMSSPYIDPPLYLGALLLRQGQAKEALRYLSEANRIDGNCPFVVCQLGMAILHSGGDGHMAVRALQKALGPRGFSQWHDAPQRAWVEGFPEQRSFIRKLAVKHAFVCPMWGGDYKALVRHGHIALGQAHYQLGQFQESSQVFDKLLQEGAPSLPVLRGLGLALARLGQHDAAFKHLRIAHEMEDPPERTTAGYLALCAAQGTPLRHEDKVKNVAWAIRLVSQFTAPGNSEWAGLVSSIFAAARGLNMPLDRDDQLNVCEHLASVHATDPLAAEAFHFLMGTNPEVMRDEYAWLYVRAAQVHHLTGPYALALFARAFADRQHAWDFFALQHWDLEAAELAYLERAAAAEEWAGQAGSFPAVLGPDYPAQGEILLLGRSRQQEQAGQLDAALASAEVLLKLAPANPHALDRLAYLHHKGRHKRAEPAQAMDLLEKWHALQPKDPLPLVRLAILAQEQDDGVRCLEKIRAALDRTEGRRRADIACLGARLMLKEPDQTSAEAIPEFGERRSVSATCAENVEPRQAAQHLLEECLRCDPNHVEASWCLASLRAVRGDEQGLARQAVHMDRPEVRDMRFHFLAGICQLAAGNFAGTLEACQRIAELAKAAPAQTATSSLRWTVEANYLAGWANLMKEDLPAAYQAFQVPAQEPASPSALHAQALLGKIAFCLKDHEDAARWWRVLEPAKRHEWNLSAALAGAVFIDALDSLHAGQYDKVADKLREAGRLGWRDRHLGPLLTLALVKAGQRLFS